MTDQPITPASLRGAVDLSALARPASPAGGPSNASGAGTSGNDNLVIAVDDASFADAMQTSATVPVIVALWSSARPDSKTHIDALAKEIRSYAGRLQLATVDIDVSLQIRQALQVQQVPMVLAILAGQPAPLYVGDQPADAIRQVLDKVLEAAAANGVTGRLDAAPADVDDAEEEPELPETHQRAFDAIEQGDYDAATAAYEQALKDNPADDEARLGLGQVALLKRTAGVDLNAARDEAAAAPTDVEKQTLVADLDVLGGHIEDAFARLIDLVKATTGDERNAARGHLVQLFDVVGPTDERVKKARTALMSALY